MRCAHLDAVQWWCRSSSRASSSTPTPPGRHRALLAARAWAPACLPPLHMRLTARAAYG